VPLAVLDAQVLGWIEARRAVEGSGAD